MYENTLNLISEMGNGWTFKIKYFSWNLIKMYENNLNLITEIGELSKFIIFHECLSNCMKITWIWNLKWVTFKMNYFSWKLMKVYENNLKLISEMKNDWTLKVIYFSWNVIKVYENTFNLITEMGELLKFNIFHKFSSKCMKITWISYLK